MSKAKVTFPSAPDTSAIDIEDEGSLIVSNPTVMNFTGPGVTVTENPTGTAEVDIPGLQYWTESEDATTQQSTIFTPNNAATNVNAVLLPKGNGANLAQTPDGTNAGGNARGQYATDWQKVRTNAAQVASGNYSTIVGGERNAATGAHSVAGGLDCRAFNSSAIAMGFSSVASGANSVNLSRISTASGSNSKVISNAGTASGQQSGVFSGLNCVSNAEASYSKGYRGYAYSLGMEATGLSETISLSGARQYGTAQIHERNDTEHTTGQVVTLGNFVPPDANRAYNIVASWTAVVIDISGTATGVNVGDYMTQCNLFGFKRVAGTGSITSITTVATHGDASMTGSASMGFSAVSNNLQAAFTGPTFAGGGTLTIRALVKLQLTEIAWTV